MNFIKDYFHSITIRRCIVMILGNVVLGLGIAVYKYAGLGNDPFSGMVMSLGDLSGMGYANFLLVVNLILFIIQLIFGRHYIGLGTIFNAFLLGYIVTFFYNIFTSISDAPTTIVPQLIFMLIGTALTGLGVSLYQTSNLGISPYDSMSIITSSRFTKVSYFWQRICTDAICALICFLTGGIVGIGTLVSAFFLGPVISFFGKNFSSKLFGPDEDILRY